MVQKPFVTANASGTTVAKGDELKITGTAEGQPATGVAIWIFGTNYYSRTTQSVNDDGTFSYTLARGTTQNLATGQYFAVVQHPMTNGVFDVDEVVEGGTTRVYDTSGNFFVAAGPGRLQGSDAANALVNLINGPNIDDTYTKLSFAVEEASIQVDAPDIRQGDQLRYHGHDQPGGRGQPADLGHLVLVRRDEQVAGVRLQRRLGQDHCPARDGRREQHVQLHGRLVPAPAGHLPGDR